MKPAQGMGCVAVPDTHRLAVFSAFQKPFAIPLVFLPKHIPLGMIVLVTAGEGEVAPQPCGEQLESGRFRIRAGEGADIQSGTRTQHIPRVAAHGPRPSRLLLPLRLKPGHSPVFFLLGGFLSSVAEQKFNRPVAPAGRPASRGLLQRSAFTFGKNNL